MLSGPIAEDENQWHGTNAINTQVCLVLQQVDDLVAFLVLKFYCCFVFWQVIDKSMVLGRDYKLIEQSPIFREGESIQVSLTYTLYTNMYRFSYSRGHCKLEGNMMLSHC